MKFAIPLVIGVVLLVVVVILSPFTLVSAGHRGVVTEFGKVHDVVLSEGFHFINPFWSIQHYDIRTQKVEADADAASKDLQSVTTKVAVNFRVSEDKVRALYQETEGKYERTLIAPALQEAVKAATAQFTAEELITKRTEVKDAMRAALAAREAMRFFVVEDVSIVNFSFSTSFNEAIERKVTAEQDALAAKNKLEQIQYEADQKVVTAKAEAESLRIQSEALANNASLIELEAVRKWNGVLPAYMMGNTVPFVNVGR